MSNSNFFVGLPGFMHSMTSSASVGIGTAVVSVVGVSFYSIYKAACRRPPRSAICRRGTLTASNPRAPADSKCKPATLSPEWKRATIKYRKAQAQDPITS